MTFYKKSLAFTLLLFTVATLGGTKAYLDHRLNLATEQWITTTLPLIATGYHGEYHAAAFSLLGAVTISDLQLTDGHKTVQIDQLMLKRAYELYRLDTIPQQLQLILQNIRWTVHDPDSTTPLLVTLLGYNAYFVSLKELTQLGYNQITIDLLANLEESDWSLTIKIIEVAGNELSITLKANCARCTLAQGAEVISTLDLTEIMVNYSDKGLMTKLFDFLAKRKKMPIADFKQAFFTRLSNDMRQSLLKIDTQSLEQLRQFIEKPNHLSLNLAITPPLAVKKLKNMNLGKSQFTLKLTNLE